MDNSKGMLTTVDNPYSPFTDWDNWLRYDREMRHNTCELLASVSKINNDMTDEEVEKIILDSTDLILDFSAYHILVYK